MKYPKDAYYLNSHMHSLYKNNEDVHNEGFYELANLLKVNKENNIYEVGFDFGERLLYLQESGNTVFGGVEFDPVFGLYKSHAKLFDHGWDIRFTQIDYWNPIEREVVITNNFLDQFQSEDVPVLLEKLLKTSTRLYLNEEIELDLPKEGNIYVVINKPRNDIKKSSKSVQTKGIELPGVKPSTDRPDREESVTEDSSGDKT